MKRLAAGLFAAALCATPVVAGEAGDILRENLYAGTLDAGEAQLRALADTDQEARFGLGFLQIMHTVQRFAQALYRHGLSAPQTGPLGPVLGIPMPPNASPEPLDYAKFRVELEALVGSLDLAHDTLVEAGTSGDYVVPIDPLLIRLDINGDGTAESGETVAAVVGIAIGEPTHNDFPSPPPAPPSDSTRSGRLGKTAEPNPQSSSVIGFDRADAIWLAGYSEVFAGQGDFLLAHDFHEFFDATFHRFFPRAGLLMQQYARGGQLVIDPETDTAIADLIAGIHTLDWPVIDHDRMLRVLMRAHAVLDLSRQNWEAILAETDDNQELVPSPTQTGLAGKPITMEQVVAWRATLDTAEDILDGKLLLPHWRFKQGFDLKAYFETATESDFVMILTGAGAIPFLEDGPIADPNSFREANAAFGGDLIGYALWFN